MTIPTVAAWQAAEPKPGLTGEALAPGLARGLEQHGPLEAARQAWSAAVANLRVEHTKITAEVAALRRERDGLGADLDAVRDAGIARVQEAAEAATAEVRRAAAEFERLSTDAAELREEVAKQARGSKEYPALYGPFRAPLRALVAWLREGVAMAGEKPMRVLLAARTHRDGVVGR